MCRAGTTTPSTSVSCVFTSTHMADAAVLCIRLVCSQWNAFSLSGYSTPTHPCGAGILSQHGKQCRTRPFSCAYKSTPQWCWKCLTWNLRWCWTKPASSLSHTRWGYVKISIYRDSPLLLPLYVLLCRQTASDPNIHLNSTKTECRVIEVCTIYFFVLYLLCENERRAAKLIGKAYKNWSICMAWNCINEQQIVPKGISVFLVLNYK